MGQHFEMYTDGSFNVTTGVYGGAYSVAGLLEGSVSDNVPELAVSRNVAGECLAVVRGVQALSQRVALHAGDSITIYHDYTGLAEWAEGRWKAKTPVATRYVAAIRVLKEKFGLQLNFVKVAAHTGVTGNELVDRLAKAAVGLSK
ncbi:MAG: hypothetical protein LBI43_06095 [Streptococcaceae bacterium]|jgi:ribonuclease HI|nr:hypothetical protein [Streptococcaceae bacterium]